MSYNATHDMSQSQSLMQRITAAVALKNIGGPSPESTVMQFKWQVISRQAWVSAWESAVQVLHTKQFNPDTGARPDVITDQMISDAIDELSGS